MKKHIKVYHEELNIYPGEFIACEYCHCKADDIHHIEPKGMGGSKTKDTIDNLIALCRMHHEQAHANIITKSQLKEIVNARVYKDRN